MYIVLGVADSAPMSSETSARPPAQSVHSEQLWHAVSVTPTGLGERQTVPQSQLANFVRTVETNNSQTPIRWVWADAKEIMPLLLGEGVSPERAHDLRLVQRILAVATTAPQSTINYEPLCDLLTENHLPPAGTLPPARVAAGQDSLFDDALLATSLAEQPEASKPTASELVAELQAQLAAIESSASPRRLKLLAAAESTGALIAAEMKFFGLPWNRQIHELLLTDTLGPRPGGYERPAKMEELAAEIRQRLASPHLNPDSPQELLKALQATGVRVKSTSKWALRGWVQENAQLSDSRQALIQPLLEYKKLSRLFTANGWNWLDEWVQNNRFYPSYEVGGVVTGRWGAHGGGAMQIPKDVRSAVAAEEGMLLTVADASQVEPRILAAMSGDRGLALAGQGTDLYMGIAEIGHRTGSALSERSQAKIALLGAMYGATTGESGRLMPHLRKLFPQAIEFTEQAARIGERGGQVSTFLGRVSPAPRPQWFEQQRRQSTAEEERAAGTAARSWGRFTRNFVVQGTAAEWALCWMAQIRQKLRSTRINGEPLRSHLVYFLHDEVIVYGPAHEAELCRRIIEDAAQSAGQIIFGHIPVEFPVSIASTDNYAKAK